MEFKRSNLRLLKSEILGIPQKLNMWYIFTKSRSHLPSLGGGLFYIRKCLICFFQNMNQTDPVALEKS